MAKSSASYGFGRVPNIILAIIPFTNVILGIVKRAQKKNWLGVILNLVLAPLFWLIDLITVLLYDKLIVLI